MTFSPGGGRGIRTHGDLRHSGFQDRCIRPLCKPSSRRPASTGRRGAQSLMSDYFFAAPFAAAVHSTKAAAVLGYSTNACVVPLTASHWFESSPENFASTCKAPALPQETCTNCPDFGLDTQSPTAA